MKSKNEVSSNWLRLSASMHIKDQVYPVDVYSSKLIKLEYVDDGSSYGNKRATKGRCISSKEGR
jgi:hypothetical protein